MKYIFGILIMVLSFSAVAQINTNGLSEEQKAVLALDAARMKSSAKVESVEQVSKWVNIGKDLGSGLNATAKELGITANELAKTPVGLFAIILIGWNYMGNDLIGIIFGFFWFTGAIPIWVWMYRSRFVIESVTTYDKGAREDGLRKIKKFQSTNEDDAVHVIYWITLLITIVIGVGAVFG